MVKTRISYRTIDTNGIRRQRIKFPKLERKLARSNYVRIRGTRFSTIVLLDEQKYFSEVLFSKEGQRSRSCRLDKLTLDNFLIEIYFYAGADNTIRDCHLHNIYHTFDPLPDNKILDWSKLKQIADDILKCI